MHIAAKPVWEALLLAMLFASSVTAAEYFDETKVTTLFAQDEAQQMFVPTRMTIVKPDAWATYTNYRRFRVNVQETLQPPPQTP